MKGIVIDLETGGKEPEICAITEIGAVSFHLQGKQLVETGHLSLQVIPHEELFVSRKAEQVQNGVFDHFYQERDTTGQFRYSENAALIYLMDGMRAHLGSDPSTWKGKIWAHNAHFDLMFLHHLEKRLCGNLGYKAAFPERITGSCTKMLTQSLMGLGKLDIRGSSLDTLCDHFNIPRDTTKRHGALYDARLTLEVMNHLLPLAG